MLKKVLISVALLLINLQAFTQGDGKNALILGTIKNEKGEPVEYAAISIKNTPLGTQSNAEGKFFLYVLPGTQTIYIQSVGYVPYEKQLKLKSHERVSLEIQLKYSQHNLDEVVVEAKSQVQMVKETPFNVVALDAKAFYNTTSDLGKLLDKASGIKIRETGGVGSGLNISLNGFTGNNVKIFMDGVPMHGFGSAFQLNNIPVGLADRIEVYKGVVPIEFGSDAMGGVINIVTNQSRRSYLDFSASYGSFNTLKTNLNVGYTAKSGFTVQVNAYQNSSDNDYKVKTEVKDLQSGTTPLGVYHWVRRFNDAYHNEAVVGKIGFVRTKWADRFLLGATLGNEYAEVQQGYRMTVVFGEKKKTAQSNLYSLNYEKRHLFFKGLNVKLNANYNISNNHSTDTVSKSYNWFGESIPKKTKGEYGNPTLSSFTNKNQSATANIGYQITRQHSLMLNDVYTAYKRSNNNAMAIVDPDNPPEPDILRRSKKNILGLSYRYMSPNEKWKTNVFGKHYLMDVTGPVNTGDSSHPNYVEVSSDYSITGYGIATTYTFKNLQLKASFEKAHRLPNDNELFGDEVLESGSADIRAEESLNYNLGATLNRNLSESSVLSADVSLFYRDTHDFIRRIVDAREGGGGSENWGQVKNIGVDAEVHYYYKNKFTVGGNATYQDMRNYERYSRGESRQLSVTYKDRMPNIPYFFGNADATYYFHDLWGKGNTLSLGYTFNFMYQVYLNWPSLGSKDSKDQIPTQLWNDFNVTYAIQNGRYNISFEAMDVNNELLYDVFYNQKPGRRFFLKFRYFITTNKKTNN
ncbi:MAG: TonB-dependent receptor plug domain-containing protein [Dysgonamonadaceae bacterium]|jgi:outer membrane cobalamin receptor|nr:TonB-dependent receptor plug domain-containing protein [Dysgonamonadaceae bacterium]